MRPALASDSASIPPRSSAASWDPVAIILQLTIIQLFFNAVFATFASLSARVAGGVVSLDLVRGSRRASFNVFFF